MSENHLELSRRAVLSAASALIVATALPAGTIEAQTPNAPSVDTPRDAPKSAASARNAAAGARLPTPGEAMPATVLVTGGTGYIGGWCIVELLRRGYSVRTTIRNLAKEPAVRAAVASAVDAGNRLTCFAADLTLDDGWDAALAGCDYVLHVASPLGGGNPNDKDSLVVPARDGALRVLRAATKAGAKRVVMTSAATAATPPMSGPDSVSDETVWFDPHEDVDAYRHSKRLAERAAFDFMKSYRGATTLTTVLPGAVFGPILTTDSLGSTEVIARLLQGRVPANPRFGLQIVDVRDLADLHIRAMTSPHAAGERFLGVGEFMWMADISQALRSQLGAAASEVPTRAMPDLLFRLFALFDPSLRAMTPRLGKMQRHTAAKAQRLLGWQARPAVATLVDCAASLISKQAI
jgi:nucleoside-diphosphate-sugar epimerase